jgi:catechol 2,3-dioxygenase-like lactoylglutathione lyase family enzyme
MAPRAVLETVLYADDLVAAEAFYSDVLGLDRVAFNADRQVFFRMDKQMLLIFKSQATRVPPTETSALPVPVHGASGAGHVCFAASASEIQTWKSKLERCGVLIEADFCWPSGGRSIYFRDPAGNSLEFAEPCIWGFDT